MEAMRPFFHSIATAMLVFGGALLIFGVVRFVRAPSLAARRAGTAETGVAERERYTRGLTDFYRISSGMTALAGVILLLITLFAR